MKICYFIFVNLKPQLLQSNKVNGFVQKNNISIHKLHIHKLHS